MPAKLNLRCGLRFNIHPDEFLQQFIGKYEPIVHLYILIQIILLQIVTILTCKIA